MLFIQVLDLKPKARALQQQVGKEREFQKSKAQLQMLNYTTVGKGREWQRRNTPCPPRSFFFFLMKSILILS